jgi:hypothetical protein
MQCEVKRLDIYLPNGYVVAFIATLFFQYGIIMSRFVTMRLHISKPIKEIREIDKMTWLMPKTIRMYEID